MSNTVAWVIGRGGLLGQALCRVLQAQGTALYAPPRAIDWSDLAALPVQMAQALDRFAVHVEAAGRWEIYWAAGVGTMGSAEAALRPESTALAGLLEALRTQRALQLRPGGLAFASSAGALHSGDGSERISEDTPPTPNTPYGRAKLQQEALIRDAFADRSQHAALLARMSTLYGAGGAPGKPQGLLLHIARCVLRNRPVQIYVPFDTIRDYLAVDDAAAAMVAALRRVGGQGGVHLRIVASEQPVTIAEIVSIFRRVAHRPLRVITSVNSLTASYSRRIQFRSAWRHDGAFVGPRTLTIGIAQLLREERLAMSRGAAAWR